MKRGIRVFTLPGQEIALNRLLNNPNISIIDKQKFHNSKENTILVYIEYEDYTNYDDVDFNIDDNIEEL